MLKAVTTLPPAPSAEPREPAVAGRFYPGDPVTLAATLRRLLHSDVEPAPALALMGPHAGYVYSGAILGETYAAVKIPPTVVVMSPNHTGRGARQSLWSGGPWLTPNGPVQIDDELAAAIEAKTSATFDRAAHRHEHAIEVHIPFIHACREDARIVPITLGRLDYPDCERLGRALAEVIRAHPTDVLIAASTDMSHYVDAATAERMDRMALDAVLALDPSRLHRTVEEHQISMCGYVPTTVALVAAKALGATTSELVRYGNSGEASGDYDRVVGYAGAIIR
jgi:AmmeMemoRadiSam system protein B